MTESEHEVVTDIDEADVVLCARQEEIERPLPPVGHGLCIRCDHIVVFRDIYPKGKPKLCTTCFFHELKHGLN